MKTTYVFEGEEYVFSNEDLKVGNDVYPISNGISNSDNKTYKHKEFDFSDYMSGFPNMPHTIIDLKNSDYKPYEIKTSEGYGPREKYFKITSKKQVHGNI